MIHSWIILLDFGAVTFYPSGWSPSECFIWLLGISFP